MASVSSPSRPPVRRALLWLGGLAVALLLLSGLAAWLAYGATPTRSGEVEVAGLPEGVGLAWAADGGVTVEASSEAGLAAGLGYAHGVDHAWTVAFWRRAARGTLGQWFGPDHATTDQLARLLGFDALARRTYDALPAAERGALDAYARGLNAALADPGVAQNDAFVLLDVTPEPWQPWDALAVERLLAYLATPAPSADSTWRAIAAADTLVADYVAMDSTLRALHGVYGTAHSRAFALRQGAATPLVQHHAVGASALPFFAGVRLVRDGAVTAVASVPGTLWMLGGLRDGFAWSVLPTARLAIEPLDGPVPPFVHSRIVGRGGDETLMTVPRDSAGLVIGRLPEPGAAPDTVRTAADVVAAEADSAAVPLASTWRVRWPGFGRGSDLAAFFALARGDVPAFRLLHGDGLVVQDGAPAVLGAPPARSLGAGAALAGGLRLTALAAPRLAELGADSAAYPPRALADDDRSPWAARRAVPLLLALGDRDSLDLAARLPYSYLRGWGASYEPTSVGATLFETWLAAHRDYAGRLPDAGDSLDALLLPQTLRIARAALRDTLGAVPSEWQWASTQPSTTAPILTRAFTRGLGGRYAARRDGPGGHPTALFPGPSLALDAEPVGPAVWSVWADAATADALTIRPPGVRRAPRADDVRDGLGVVRLDRRTAVPTTLRLVPA